MIRYHEDKTLVVDANLIELVEVFVDPRKDAMSHLNSAPPGGCPRKVVAVLIHSPRGVGAEKVQKAKLRCRVPSGRGSDEFVKHREVRSRLVVDLRIARDGVALGV